MSEILARLYAATAEQEDHARIAQPTHTSYPMVLVPTRRNRDPGRVSSLPSESWPLPNPKSLVQHAHLLSPLSREAQQMRPSSISCKPPAGRTPVPIDNPMPGGFILLGLCCLWPSSYFPVPERLAGPSGSLGGRGLPLLLFCLSLLSFPREHDRGGGMDSSPPPPAHAWTQRSFIHIRSFSR